MNPERCLNKQFSNARIKHQTLISETGSGDFSWDTTTDLKVLDTPDKDELMDINFITSSSLDSIEEIAEKLLNEDSVNLKYITESELKNILRIVISHLKENPNDFNKDVFSLLNVVFSASFNDALLMKHLKSLNLEDILVTLDILLKYLNHSINIPVDALQRPSDLQIVNWICLMISSHTETLLFTKEKAVKKLLKNLKETLSVKIEEFEDLEGLQSYLSICCNKKDILPQHYSVEKYCLETLDL